MKRQRGCAYNVVIVTPYSRIVAASFRTRTGAQQEAARWRRAHLRGKELRLWRGSTATVRKVCPGEPGSGA